MLEANSLTLAHFIVLSSRPGQQESLQLIPGLAIVDTHTRDSWHDRPHEIDHPPYNELQAENKVAGFATVDAKRLLPESPGPLNAGIRASTLILLSPPHSRSR